MIPIEAEITSWVCSHGPEYLIVGGDPGGAAGPSRSKKDVSCINRESLYRLQYVLIVQKLS
jgi:hypothetical protein